MSTLQSFAKNVFPLSVYPLPRTQVLKGHSLPHDTTFSEFMIGKFSEPFLLAGVQRPFLSTHPGFRNLIVGVKSFPNNASNFGRETLVLTEK